MRCLEMVDGPLYGNSSRKEMIKHQHLDTNADGFGYVIWDVSKSNLVTYETNSNGFAVLTTTF